MASDDQDQEVPVYRVSQLPRLLRRERDSRRALLRLRHPLDAMGAAGRFSRTCRRASSTVRVDRGIKWNRIATEFALSTWHF